MFYIYQRQPHNDQVELLYECVSEAQAQDECDRVNSHLADYGIPGEYYLYYN